MTDDVEAPTVVDTPIGHRTATVRQRRRRRRRVRAGGGEPRAAADVPPRRSKRSSKRAFVEWGILIVVAIVIAIVIKTFLFQAFYIPSESMVPTLEVGDRVLVNKLSYDLHDLHRGDIVVFAAEPNVEWHRAGIDDLVKRVIALPGRDRHAVRDRPDLHRRPAARRELPPEGHRHRRSRPTCPSITNASGKKVLVCDPVGPNGSPEGGCKVPAGKVFVMGDNRANSQDARANGPIKESSIVGRVFLRIWPPGRIGFM